MALAATAQHHVSGRRHHRLSLLWLTSAISSYFVVSVPLRSGGEWGEITAFYIIDYLLLVVCWLDIVFQHATATTVFDSHMPVSFRSISTSTSVTDISPATPSARYRNDDSMGDCGASVLPFIVNAVSAPLASSTASEAGEELLAHA